MSTTFQFQTHFVKTSSKIENSICIISIKADRNKFRQIVLFLFITEEDINIEPDTLLEYSIKEEEDQDYEPIEDTPEDIKNVKKSKKFKKSKGEFRCDECGKQCKTEKHLLNHKNYHRYYLNGEQEFCEKCNRNIPIKLFPRHLQTVHPDSFQVIFN